MGIRWRAENTASAGLFRADLAASVLGFAAFIAVAGVQFQKAAMQSDVADARMRMAATAAALEAYEADNGDYLACNIFGYAVADPMNPVPVLERLTTPIAYLPSLEADPFGPAQGRLSGATAADMASATPVALDALDQQYTLNFFYQAWNDEGRSQTRTDGFTTAFAPANAWVLQSPGPDRIFYSIGGVLTNDRDPDGPILLIYDPTNGTMSRGSIWSTGGSSMPTQDYAAGAGLVEAIGLAQQTTASSDTWLVYE